ncbi:MAG: carboxy terminal-processing peptidase [Planctomycetaceae bacterium]
MASLKPSRSVQVLMVFLALVVVTVTCVQQLSSAERIDSATAKLISQMVPRFHINRPPIDDAASTALLDNYLKSLDPLHLYFLQSNVDQFHTHQTTLDDELRAGNVQFGYQVHNVFKERVHAQLARVQQLIDAEYDFTGNDAKAADYTKLPWAATQEELDDRWRKAIELELLAAKIDDEDLTKLREDIHKRYRNFQRIIDQREDLDVLEIYLTSLTTCFDPHSSYMSPQSWEDFEIDLKLSLDGIGASLQSDDGYVIVRDLVPGGAAARDGRLQRDDKITGVAQIDSKTGQMTEVVDVYEMKLTHVVRMIRGERGTKVVLRVQPKGSTENKLYELTRDKVELSSQEVKGEVIDGSERLGRPGKIGVIKLPTFYRDFAGAQGGIEGFKSAAADMAPYLAEFRRQGVEAVVVDLRNNTGGALSEAIEVTGHFIDEGPVVQVRESEVNGARVLEDELPGTLWNGPLVLICNRMSASASEIFAGAIKDYHRGLIIGDFTTHGKGTVQNLMEVSPSQMFRLFDSPDRGKLKLTIQQFYRVNGDSTQNYGVRSDVVLPSLLDHMDTGESFLDHALPFHKIAEARYTVNSFVNPEIVSSLQQRSQQRVSANPDFQKLTRVIDRYVERKNRETVVLNEESLRKEREVDQLTEKELDPETEDAIDDVRDESKKPIFPKNAYNDEVLGITLDYVQSLNNRVTVKR